VADSIEMSVTSTTSGEIAPFSPDASQFVVVRHKGNLANNTTEYSLTLFRSDSVFRSPNPQVILVLATSSNQPAIRDLRWVDNRTIVFLGNAGGSSRSQILSLDVPTRKLTEVSASADSIVAFDSTPDLSAVAFVSRPAPQSYFDRSSVDRGLMISTQQFADLLTDARQDPIRLLLQRHGAGPREIPLQGQLILPSVDMSPDGNHLVVQERVPANSDAWDKYNIRKDFFLVRYVLVDADSGSAQPLIDAPALSGRVGWLHGSKSLVLPETFLPLNGTSVGREGSAQGPVTAEVELKTGVVRTITKGYADVLRWDSESDTLVLRPRPNLGSYKEPVTYRKATNNTWIRTEAATSSETYGRGSLAVQEEQDMNTPPRLVVANEKTKEKGVLMELNPQFRNLEFGRVEEISWKGTDGQDNRGGLYLPPDVVAGRKYPLVIQLEGWDAHKFWIDGPSTAGYAAQELAGRDFVVAQVALPSLKDLTTSHEGPAAMASIEGLIDHLDQRGIIDRGWIGLLGWSRTGYHVRYTLTFSKYAIAAAVIADGMDASYVQYISWLNTGENAGYTYEQINGSEPFGQGLQSWLKHATGFNLERVHTPVFLIGFRKYSLLNNWEWFAGLQRLGKPVEFIWLPDAEHSPVKPLERLTVQGGTVDWFRFWLKGEEDPDPAKTEQYKRWRLLPRNSAGVK
jgi:dipeptidyl aminopeptidase/acylaminoacyl peptidase